MNILLNQSFDTHGFIRYYVNTLYVARRHIKEDHLTDLENFSIDLDALPLTESTFFILVCLEEAPKHGYAIMKEVESLSRGRVKLSTGTLFGAIKRLLGKGWIQRSEAVKEVADGRARKYYDLTHRGRRVMEAETQRLRELVAIAGRRTVSGATASVD